MPSYPIDSILPQLKQSIIENSSVVLQAPPGAGKTTRVPLALLEVLPGRIIMLEPRRIAAVSAARWMAQTLNEQPGGTIGYTIRFDSKTGAKTRIEVVTEGVLTRRIQSDPGLEGVSLVIFDEFHERSIHADLALALCLDIQNGLRPDLRILVMSATLDTGPIASLLGNAPVVTSSGKAFPVEERYLELKPDHASARMKSAVLTALRETDGDVLAFLPGSGEIRACAGKLQETGDIAGGQIELHQLFGDLPFEEQERAILPSKDRRKIVLATNIAETSLTIEGVRVVIDSGLTRRMRYDPATGMNRLVTMPVSKSSAEQRKGRAGRTGPGVCYRLYGKHELRGMPDHAPPEILKTDLSGLVLQLAAWGVKDPSRLSWLDVPPAPARNSGVRLLQELGALDAGGSVTQTGRKMARLPVHPRLGRLMIRAGELGCPDLGADLAALLSERDIVRRIAGEPGAGAPDIMDRINMLRSWRTGKEAGGAEPQALRTVDRTARQLSRLASGPAKSAAETGDHETTARLLLAAYPDRVCKRREESVERFLLPQGRGVRISAGSHLVNNQYIIVPVLDAGEKAEGTVHLAAPVTEELIRSECAGAIETVRKVEWDRAEGRVAAAVEERIGAVLLSKRIFIPSDDEVLSLLCDAVRTTPGVLTFGSAARQLQARVALIARSFPEESWPDLSNERLLSKPEEWLLPWLGGIRAARDLRNLDTLPALRTLLTREQQRLLDERTPLHITVPSGSKVKVDYTKGEAVLAVKLQEMFGLADTPTIAGGRVKLLLHLLSPSQRPVQITRDLKSFWNTVYPLVRKDLKGRYPKHPWPDDPWNAVPTKRTKRRIE